MKNLALKRFGLFFCLAACLLNFSFTGCRVYRFSEAGQVPPHVKTVKIVPIENVAPYVNPQLTPNLTDRLRQKINNQTKLSLTNNDNANWVISGQIIDYTPSTAGVTSANGRSQASINRLTVSVRITLTDQVQTVEPRDITVTRQFDFPASQTLQQAEQGLLDEILRNLTDEIFNQIFSNW